MKFGGYIYIITNKNNTVLYTGVTSNLGKRIEQHRHGEFINAFTKKYNCTKLLYFEGFNRIEDAISREKQIKGGSRIKKIKMIESLNPKWNDLIEFVDE